jgi:hypothetical protein
MASPWPRRIAALVLAAAGIGAAAWALQPQPVPVDIAEIARGTLRFLAAHEADAIGRPVQAGGEHVQVQAEVPLHAHN